MNPTKNYKLRFDKMSNSGTGKFRPNKFIKNSITKLVKLQILYLLKSVSLTVKFFSCESIINFWNYKVLIQIVSAMVRWSTEYCRCDLNMLIVFCHNQHQITQCRTGRGGNDQTSHHHIIWYKLWNKQNHHIA